MTRKLTLGKTFGMQQVPGGTYTFEFSRQVQRSFDEVWSALSKPEKLAVWMTPVAGKLAKGGAFTVGDLASGTISHCDPKRRLSLSLAQGTVHSLAEISFVEEGKGKARIRLMRVKVTARIDDLPEGIWAKFGPATLGIGWELLADAVLDYIDAPKTPRSEDAMLAYANSAEGVAYCKGALDGWIAAAKAQGLDLPSVPAPSLLQFYTGLHR